MSSNASKGRGGGRGGGRGSGRGRGRGGGRGTSSGGRSSGSASSGGRGSSSREGRRGESKQRDRMKNAGFGDDYKSGQNKTPRHEYQEMSAQQLQHRREDEQRNQDAALDALHVGVTGLKHHAININEEIQNQDLILNDLNSNIELTAAEIQQQTEKARKVNKKKAQVLELYK